MDSSFPNEIMTIIRTLYIRVLMKDITSIVHNLARMRKFLRKNKSENSYIKNKRQNLEKNSLLISGQLAIINNIKIYNNNWVKLMEKSTINCGNLNMMPFIYLHHEYLDLRKLVRSQLSLTDRKKNEEKCENHRMNIVGVIVANKYSHATYYEIISDVNLCYGEKKRPRNNFVDDSSDDSFDESRLMLKQFNGGASDICQKFKFKNPQFCEIKNIKTIHN